MEKCKIDFYQLKIDDFAGGSEMTPTPVDRVEAFIKEVKEGSQKILNFKNVKLRLSSKTRPHFYGYGCNLYELIIRFDIVD